MIVRLISATFKLARVDSSGAHGELDAPKTLVHPPAAWVSR